MSTMNPAALPLAKSVLHQITTVPESFNMDVWCDAAHSDEPKCGTTACLAGWAMILSGEYELDRDGLPIELDKMSTSEIESTGARLLGLPLVEVAHYADQGRALFYASEETAIQRLSGLIEAAESRKAAA